jgi:hypothetical protein
MYEVFFDIPISECEMGIYIMFKWSTLFYVSRVMHVITFFGDSIDLCD